MSWNIVYGRVEFDTKSKTLGGVFLFYFKTLFPQRVPHPLTMQRKHIQIRIVSVTFGAYLPYYLTFGSFRTAKNY